MIALKTENASIIAYGAWLYLEIRRIVIQFAQLRIQFITVSVDEIYW
jgi:hypothetical protein